MQAVRGVNVSGVIHTLLNRKLISTAGRKKVIGRPMMYKTTKEFLVQFGLGDLSELPNLKELEELSRGALGEGEEQVDSAEEKVAAEPSEQREDTPVERADDQEAASEPADEQREGAGVATADEAEA